MSDFFDGADERLDKKAEEREQAAQAAFWNPEAGETLKGIAISGTRLDDKSGRKAYQLLVKDIVGGLTLGGSSPEDDRISQKGDVVKVWCGRSGLIRFIEEDAPAMGKGVVMRYDGLIDLDNGRTYHAYQIDVEAMDHKYWEDARRAYDAGPGHDPRSTGRPDDPMEAPF